MEAERVVRVGSPGRWGDAGGRGRWWSKGANPSPRMSVLWGPARRLVQLIPLCPVLQSRWEGRPDLLTPDRRGGDVT